MGPATGLLYDGLATVQEQQNGAVSATLANGAGLDEHLARTPVGGSEVTLLADALGSTLALATSAGTVATSYGYDPYGVPSTSGTADTNPYLFTGAPVDATGLVHLRARDYNPAWGRFISEDPIGLRGGVNRYAYVGGDPVDFVDRSGLAIGDYPPAPPGYDPGTWSWGQFGDGTPYLEDPSGNQWIPHPEDPGHWRHWDPQDPGGKQLPKCPPNNQKPRPGQKRPPYGGQSATDPTSPDAPPLNPPVSSPQDPAPAEPSLPSPDPDSPVMIPPTPFAPGTPTPLIPEIPIEIPLFP